MGRHELLVRTYTPMQWHNPLTATKLVTECACSLSDSNPPFPGLTRWLTDWVASKWNTVDTVSLTGDGCSQPARVEQRIESAWLGLAAKGQMQLTLARCQWLGLECTFNGTVPGPSRFEWTLGTRSGPLHSDTSEIIESGVDYCNHRTIDAHTVAPWSHTTWLHWQCYGTNLIISYTFN